MLQPLKSKNRNTRGPLAVERNLPPPVGGWNKIDAVTSMPATDATDLDNFYPQASYVEFRGGSEFWADMEDTGTIKTLATYTPAVADDQVLLAFTENGVYDATFGGDISSKIVPRTEGRHQWVNMGDGTNSWLMAFNGVDKPLYYGTGGTILVDALSSPAITGVTTTSLVGAAVFKQRLLLIENDKMGFWYLPSGVVGGAATYFDLSPFASEGGYLMAVATWTRDGGLGPDDYAVFITSEGQALVYAGTDPSSANTWALVGTYDISRPLGRRCVLQFGADPLVLTEQGFFPLSALLSSGDARAKFALSYKIQPAFVEAAQGRVDTFGWQAVSYEQKNAILINVPFAEGGRHDQYVMNTITKAWCRFTGWPAECLVVFRGVLYFAKGARVMKAWAGQRASGYWDSSTGYQITADETQPIVYYARQSFQNYGSQRPKFPNLFKPLFDMSKPVSYSIGFDVDFGNADISGATIPSQEGVLIWNESNWDEATWGESSAVTHAWGGDSSWLGRWLAPKLLIESDSASGKWLGSVLRYEEGDGL